MLTVFVYDLATDYLSPRILHGLISYMLPAQKAKGAPVHSLSLSFELLENAPAFPARLGYILLHIWFVLKNGYESIFIHCPKHYLPNIYGMSPTNWSKANQSREKVILVISSC